MLHFFQLEFVFVEIMSLVNNIIYPVIYQRNNCPPLNTLLPSCKSKLSAFKSTTDLEVTTIVINSSKVSYSLDLIPTYLLISIKQHRNTLFIETCSITAQHIKYRQYAAIKTLQHITTLHKTTSKLHDNTTVRR